MRAKATKAEEPSGREGWRTSSSGVMPKGERLGGSLAHLGKQPDSLKEPSPRRGQAEKTTNQPP